MNDCEQTNCYDWNVGCVGSMQLYLQRVLQSTWTTVVRGLNSSEYLLALIRHFFVSFLIIDFRSKMFSIISSDTLAPLVFLWPTCYVMCIYSQIMFLVNSQYGPVLRIYGFVSFFHWKTVTLILAKVSEHVICGSPVPVTVKKYQKRLDSTNR